MSIDDKIKAQHLGINGPTGMLALSHADAERLVDALNLWLLKRTFTQDYHAIAELADRVRKLRDALMPVRERRLWLVKPTETSWDRRPFTIEPLSEERIHEYLIQHDDKGARARTLRMQSTWVDAGVQHAVYTELNDRHHSTYVGVHEARELVAKAQEPK